MAFLASPKEHEKLGIESGGVIDGYDDTEFNFIFWDQPPFFL